ncbi:glycoside hydrolase family 15 protein [Verticiella sediminum]|uniref:Trehalase n=1 Tax=Verticiella sediminum TaxID=1247510 RepID=A0A556ASA4_9BURK|nr:glycoside hydrolase family 15 protein [Verticiella sediminum]TSH95800.1 glycoside hydrolase family 15 protein [Verticiella sediminum]
MSLYKQPPIADYALIGDCQTAALVNRHGCIDWLCWPRFDSAACLTRLLGDDEHGYWHIGPMDGGRCASRRYLPGTLILESRFETSTGTVTISDFMPVRKEGESLSNLMRIVRGVSGSVRMRLELAIRFDYGRIVPWVSRTEGGALRAVAGPHAVMFYSAVPTRGDGYRTVAEFTVQAGDELHFCLNYEPSHLPISKPPDPAQALVDTCAFWEAWSQRSRYRGAWPEAVERSLITIKALTHRPTGGIVAAPTTSLPEHLGGERNWDYRYCWLRDATFTLLSLLNAGYRDEAESWCDWLLRAVAGSAEQIQPLYGLAGEPRLREETLDHLPGYHGSAPVRVGNAACSQLQLDVFGSAMDTFHEARSAGLRLHHDGLALQRHLIRHLDSLWQLPDEGIWEVRGEKQHFVHSKLMCWVAFDRAVQGAERFGMPGPVDAWRSARERLRAEILERGFDARVGAFTQAYGSTALDASVLLIPLVGFLPADDPRMRSTVRAIQRSLTEDGLVLRYDTGTGHDGLAGKEGVFLACTFWLADNLILQGRRDEARQLFERLLALRNDVGLLAEQYDPAAGRQLGNFPQAFSHFALIDTAFNFEDTSGLARDCGGHPRNLG